MNPGAWVDQFTALIAPARCAYCNTAAANGVCAACREELPWNRAHCPGCALPQRVAAPCPACLKRPRAFDAAWTAFVLEAPIRHAVHRLKYGAAFDQGRLLGTLMARALTARSGPLPQLLVPVPLHPRRLLARGYNQAMELARHLHRELQVPVDAQAARRLHDTPDQIGLRAAQRRRNLRGAFAFNRPLDGLHVALLDDVMTTGATLEELARAARRAGAARIEGWALARVP